MNRIVHIFGVHRFDQETIGGDHDPRIARLHRHDDLIEPLRLADPQKLHRRDDHALRRIAPAVENALRERPVIDTDAQCDAPLAALGDQRLQLAVIRTVIARIDAHLVDIFRGDGGDLRHEVDVGDDRRVETVLTPPITTRPMRTSPLGRRLYSERFIIVHACNAADRTVPSQRRIAPNTAGTRPVRAKISLTKTVQVERRAENRLCRDAACLSRSLSSAKITHNFANCE